MLQIILDFLLFLLMGMWFWGVRFNYMDKIIAALWLLKALLLVI